MKYQKNQKAFPLEWKVVTCAFWRMWPLPVSGAIMQVDNNGIDKWGLLQPSWLLSLPSLPASSHLSSSIWSSLYLKCSIPPDLHLAGLLYKDLTKCQPLWSSIQTFQLLLVFGWVHFFGIKSQIHYLLAVQTWAI